MRYNGLFAATYKLPGNLRRVCLAAFVLILISSFTALAIAPASDTNDDLRKLLRQADKLRRSGAFDQAESILRRAVEMDPKRSEAMVELAYVLTKQRKIRESYDLAFKVAEAERKNSGRLPSWA